MGSLFPECYVSAYIDTPRFSRGSFLFAVHTTHSKPQLAQDARHPKRNLPYAKRGELVQSAVSGGLGFDGTLKKKRYSFPLVLSLIHILPAKTNVTNNQCVIKLKYMSG